MASTATDRAKAAIETDSDEKFRSAWCALGAGVGAVVPFAGIPAQAIGKHIGPATERQRPVAFLPETVDTLQEVFRADIGPEK